MLTFVICLFLHYIYIENCNMLYRTEAVHINIVFVIFLDTRPAKLIQEFRLDVIWLLLPFWITLNWNNFIYFGLLWPLWVRNKLSYSTMY